MKNSRNIFISGSATNQSLLTVALTLIIVAAVVGIVFVMTGAIDSTSNTATVTNATPSVTVTAASTGAGTADVTLTENTTTTAYIYGTGTDTNGCDDIDTATSWDSTLYRTNLGAGNGCTADNANCYSDSSATLTLGACTALSGTTTITYQFAYPVQYYADPTDSGTYGATSWTGYVRTVDEAASAVGTGSDTVEINTTTALEVDTGDLAFGSVTLGTTAGPRTIVIKNTGNSTIDYSIAASGAMSCTRGTVAANRTQYSFATATHSADGGDSKGIQGATEDRNLAKATASASSSESSYFRLNIASGAGGACSNTVTFTAIAT